MTPSQDTAGSAEVSPKNLPFLDLLIGLGSNHGAVQLPPNYADNYTAAPVGEKEVPKGVLVLSCRDSSVLADAGLSSAKLCAPVEEACTQEVC